MNVIDLLRTRGLVEAVTSKELSSLCEKPLSLYVGFDPTADSLHLGNLVAIILLKWFEKFGHKTVVVLGGATGRIGDPSGKSTERPLLSISEIEANIASIALHFGSILERPILVNNETWLGQVPVVDFLRDYGKHFRVSVMLSKESVKSRLTSEEGISFTEFTYQVLQAYDFYHLYHTQGVILQCGGSDQWGNITAGIDLIRKLAGKTAYGLTFPLLTRSDGKKFGKSEEGAIWLSPTKCSPYAFYQYLFRIADADVIPLMRVLTFMEMEEIRQLEQEMNSPSYLPNTAQKKLAEEVTRIVHGEAGVEQALRATGTMVPGGDMLLDGARLRRMRDELPHLKIEKWRVEGKSFIEVAVLSGLSSSKSEAHRLILQGGAYLNNIRLHDPQYKIERKHFIEEEFLLLGAGKRKKIVLCLLDPTTQ